MADMRKLVIATVAILTISGAPGFAYQQPRSVNITSDSAPGWLPSEEQEASAEEAALNYFEAYDEGQFALSYALLTPEMKRSLASAEHAASGQLFNNESGALVSRKIIKVTWTKDPANAPRPGVYAAIDLSSRYVNIDRHCGYLIAYQAADNEPFLVMRTQSTMLTNEAAAAFQAAGQDVDQVWRRISQASCPNYSPAVDETL